MVTITYCKALPEPIEELNALGITKFEALLIALAPIFRKAVCETVQEFLSGNGFNKSTWNTHLQETYQINKRHANGVIASAKGQVESAKECRQNHIKQLQGKLKSAHQWLKKSEKKLKDARKFYRKKNWEKSKNGCRFPLSCSLKDKGTNWQHLRSQIHHKKRYIYHLTKKIEYLKSAQVKVKVPSNQVFVVGSKTESYGNQVCQWDGKTLKFRVPYCLEKRFGKYVETEFAWFKRNINRMPVDGSKTWHFYYKQGKWVGAVQFTPEPVLQVSRSINYGAIGLDINPGSIGWAYCDADGNLREHGQIPLEMGLPKNKQNAQIINSCLAIKQLADKYASPVVIENLDFGKKKEQLREENRKYSRMLSSWAYNRFAELLEAILNNRGIQLIKINPAYSSLIGLVKYARMYGLASDEAAALVIARRGMRLSERVPRSLTAYPLVKRGKHVWSAWNKLNKLVKSWDAIESRHDYYSISVSDWESMVKPQCEPFG
jgi:IS605 OrfB family transposase